MPKLVLHVTSGEIFFKKSGSILGTSKSKATEQICVFKKATSEWSSLRFDCYNDKRKDSYLLAVFAIGRNVIAPLTHGFGQTRVVSHSKPLPQTSENDASSTNIYKKKVRNYEIGTNNVW